MFGLLVKVCRDFRNDFWGVFFRWQDRRPIWLLGGGLALFLELFSWVYFQTFLRLNPCEMCVYIRFSMLAMLAGALFAAIKPNRLVFKLGGYLIVFWGLIRGIIWNIALEKENLKSGEELWSSGCSPAEANFPFGLPWSEWLPSHFRPTGICGEDNWHFLGFNMSEWLFLVYGCFAAVISCMFIGWLVGLKRKTAPH